MHKGNTGLFGGLLHGEGLHLVERAELQGHVDDAVGMQVARHLDDVLHTLVVGGKDGAVDLKVALGDSVEHLVDRLAGLVDQVLVVARTRAGLLAHHDAASLLDQVEQLPVGHGHGRAGVQDALGALGRHALTIGGALLALGSHVVDGAGQARRVVHKGSLHGQQAIETADGRRVGGTGRSQTLQGAALLVNGVDGSLQALGRDLDAALFLDLGSELFDLGLPGHERRLVVHVGDIHDVHVLLRGKELIGLLLAVASVLADYQVARLDVGADLAQLKASKALDERTGVARQMLLDLVRCPVGTRAQAHGNTIARKHDFLGHIDAERADDLGGLAGLLLVEHLLNTAAMNVGGNKIQVGSGLGAIVLRQEHIPVHLAHGTQQHVVVGKIHAEALPHRMEIEFFSHGGSPLEPKMNSYGIAARWVAKTQPCLNPEFWGTCFAVDDLVVRRLSRSREHTCSYAAPSHIEGARGNATRICLLRHRRALLFSSKVTISTVVVQTNTADTRTTASGCEYLAD